MKHAIRLSTVLALFATTAFAQDQKPIPDNSEQMRRLAWLAGAWEGKGEMPGYGKYEFTYVLSWTMSKNFLKADYRMTVGGKVMWQDTGMLGWDKDNKRFRSFVFGMDGTIGHASEVKPESIGVTPRKGKKAIAFEGQTSGNSPWKHFRTVILQIDKDTLQVETHVRKGDKWVVMDKSKATRSAAKNKTPTKRKKQK